MDRDLALKLANSLSLIKNSVTALATNTTPTTADSRSVEQQRTVTEPEVVEHEPVEPETRK